MPSADESFRVSVNGRVYEIDPGDFDRREWRELKRVLDMTQAEVFTNLAQLDLDTVAGMVWLQLRREQPDLAFDDVNLKLSDLYEQEGEADPPG